MQVAKYASTQLTKFGICVNAIASGCKIPLSRLSKCVVGLMPINGVPVRASIRAHQQPQAGGGILRGPEVHPRETVRRRRGDVQGHLVPDQPRWQLFQRPCPCDRRRSTLRDGQYVLRDRPEGRRRLGQRRYLRRFKIGRCMQICLHNTVSSAREHAQ